MRKLIAVILTVIMIASCAMLVFGDSTMNTKEKPDLGKACSLTVHFADGTTKFADETVNLYKVADLDENKQYTVSGSFKTYPITIVGLLDADDYRIMKQTVSSYIIADKIAPDKTGKTDANGDVVFSNLSCGLYMVDNLRVLKDEQFTTFEAFMVAVPGFPDDTIKYDVTSNPKITDKKPTDGIATYKVVVVWDDKGDNSKRPNQVQVEIFKDGVSVEKVYPTEANDWSYQWQAVDDGSVWSVVETNPETEYSISYDLLGDTFEVINSYSPIPKTGDRDMTIYLVLMVLAGAGLIVLGLTSQKKSKQDA